MARKRRRRNPPMGMAMYLVLGGIAYLMYQRWQRQQALAAVKAVTKALPMVAF